ncbi:MAG: hypothetical protein IAE80_03585 [Anaerolinea sp.]|nr:hypothetical protein [Anaerolinea sp.]
MEQHELEKATPESSKRTYSTPRLSAYGDVSSLTHFNADGFTLDPDPFVPGYS